MASCAYCNATILFGARQVGDLQYCSTHHALLGRSLTAAAATEDVADLRETIRALQDDLLALAEEVQQHRTALSEAQERIDFLERIVAHLRDPSRPVTRPAGS